MLMQYDEGRCGNGGVKRRPIFVSDVKDIWIVELTPK